MISFNTTVSTDRRHLSSSLCFIHWEENMFWDVTGSGLLHDCYCLCYVGVIVVQRRGGERQRETTRPLYLSSFSMRIFFTLLLSFILFLFFSLSLSLSLSFSVLLSHYLYFHLSLILPLSALCFYLSVPLSCLSHLLDWVNGLGLEGREVRGAFNRTLVV